MGGIFITPLIVMVVSSVYVWLVYRGYPTDSMMVQIRGAFGVFSLPFISVWIIGLFQDIVESDGKESLLSLPYRAPFFGIIRVIRMTLLYIVLFFIVLLALTLIMFGSYPPLDACDWYLPIVSILFFSGLSFFCIVLTKNTLISYTILCVYCVFQYMTRGGFSLSIYPFQWSFSMPYTSNVFVACLLLVSTCFLYGGSQIIFSKREYLLK